MGCGPGRFVAEFAKKAKHVTGLDLSPKMLQYRSAFCDKQGLFNVSFNVCDFETVDIGKSQWFQAFKLVFASITPATQTFEGLKKALSMSRGYFFNIIHLYRKNGFLTEMAHALTDSPLPQTADGRQTFYCMFNLIWLEGYYPEIMYYREQGEHKIAVTNSTVQRYAAWLFPQGPSKTDLERVHVYMMQRADKDGIIRSVNDRLFGCLLINVSKKG